MPLRASRRPQGHRHSIILCSINCRTPMPFGQRDARKASASDSINTLMNAEAIVGFPPKGPADLLEVSF